MFVLPEAWPLLADALAVALLAAYHLRLLYDMRRTPRATTLGRNREVRRAWLQEISTRRADLLAVQTLRNWAMTATFLASSAILIAIGIVHFIFVNAPGAGAVSPLLRAEHAGTKLLLLAGVFFAAFFFFAQTLRAINHLGFEAAIVSEGNFEEILGRLHRQADNFTLGMRGFYLALPCAMWLFGSLPFLAATAVLVVLLRRLDYAGQALHQ